MSSKVYTISLNPAIDYILNFKNFEKGKTNRPNKKDMYAAGKGIHVSMLLNQMNFKNEAIVFVGGFFEKFFLNSLRRDNISYKTFKSNGEIRINLKLIDDFQTECSVMGPDLENKEFETMLIYLKKVLKPGDFVIATGSLANNSQYDAYKAIGQIVNEKKANFIVDAFGKALLEALSVHPFLIKPNHNELELTLGRTINSNEELIIAAKELQKKGAQNILISQGKEGATLVTKNKIYKCPIFNWDKPLKNAAGAGDSMLAGFISEYCKSNDFKSALRFAIICGSATAYSNRIAEKELIFEMDKAAQNLISSEIE